MRSANGSAQSASSSGSAQGAVVPVRLLRPVYPPIAVSARVSGDVEVNVRVRPDSSVESATIVSGPTLLQQAALEAAQKSSFECRGCSEAATPYSVVFAFQLVGETQSAAEDDQRGTVTETPSQSRVTIVAETPFARPLSLVVLGTNPANFACASWHPRLFRGVARLALLVVLGRSPA